MSTRKKILVVDDEPDVVTWLSVLLQEHGYDIITAVDGAEGFRKAESDHPDLITLDLSMGEDSGIKMYSRLLKSEALTGIPVIMVTGASRKVNDFLARMRKKKSPAGFFEKPVDAEEFLAKVKELIG